MRLSVGMQWGGFCGGDIVGVSKVTIGDHTWKCLKMRGAAQPYETPGESPGVYAECYVAEEGRTVFFRRFNAPGYREPDRYGSFESLAGQVEVEFKGITFRHWYDCIPDIAMEKALRR